MVVSIAWNGLGLTTVLLSKLPYAEIIDVYHHTWLERLTFKIDLWQKKITGQCFSFKYLEQVILFSRACQRNIQTILLYTNCLRSLILLSLRLCVTSSYSPFLGVAFLLMDAKECMTSAEEIFVTKIEKFINIHQNSFLVLFAPLHGPEEWSLMFRIHQRYGSKAQPVFLSFVYFSS
jgi:hypothetical protein